MHTLNVQSGRISDAIGNECNLRSVVRIAYSSDTERLVCP